MEPAFSIASLDWQPHAQGLVIGVWAQPGARKNAVLGIHNRLLKIAVTAPPENGRANAALTKFLAQLFGISRSRVELISGDTQRHKKFLLVDFDSHALQSQLS